MPTKPNITRKPGEPLTKENFWNALKQAYPNSIEVFCEWIDLYKEMENWRELFNPDGILVTVAPGKTEDRSPRFHDLPLAMQLGVIIEYLESEGAVYVIDFALERQTGNKIKIGGRYPFIESIIDNLVEYFKDSHNETAAEHRAEKLKPFKDNEPFNS